MKTPIRTLEELRGIGKTFIDSIEKKDHAHVLALSGDLGAGKTAFVKELAQLLQISHEVTSPTFVIMKSYEIEAHAFLKTLTHIDAYRIEEERELAVLGLEEHFKNSSELVCIEWPERIPNLIPHHAHRMEFNLESDETRTVTLDINE